MNKLMCVSAGASAILLTLICLAAPGCSVDKQDPTTRTSDAALRNPMGFKEDVPPPDSISGGDTGNLDRKGIKRDIDSVLNP